MRDFTSIVLVFAITVVGCAVSPNGPWGHTPQQAGFDGAIYVATLNEELVWERTIDVLHEFQFEIDRENRLAKVIRTAPKVGASIFEPWHKDAVGLDSRLEGTLQSVRRIVEVSMQLDDQGRGYVVSVAVYKESEDLPGLAANSPGAATFSESEPLTRNLDPVVGQSTPSLWVPAGRDPRLEQALLQRLRSVLSR